MAARAMLDKIRMSSHYTDSNSLLVLTISSTLTHYNTLCMPTWAETRESIAAPQGMNPSHT